MPFFRPTPLVLTLSVNTDVNCQSGQVIHHFEGHVQEVCLLIKLTGPMELFLVLIKNI